jgi:hypothetical protein
MTTNHIEQTFLNRPDQIRIDRRAAANCSYPKGGLSSFEDTFVVSESSVLRLNFSGNLPALRVAAFRYSQL